MIKEKEPKKKEGVKRVKKGKMGKKACILQKYVLTLAIEVVANP